MSVDGQEQGPFDGLGADTIRFSADSAHVAFAQETGGKRQLVLDGHAIQASDGLAQGGPTFEPAGTLQCLTFKDGVIYRVQYTP